MILDSIPIRNAPATVPDKRPTPPAMDAPPTTAAVMESMA